MLMWGAGRLPSLVPPCPLGTPQRLTATVPAGTGRR
jgi:hypothetical protein